MITSNYFSQLLLLAQKDLSSAHLTQHHTTAKMFANLAEVNVQGTGTWSALKPRDTVVYDNGTITGKKHWVSGVNACNWVAITAVEGQKTQIVIANTCKEIIEFVPTVGMEGTHTAHLNFNQYPATAILDRHDPRCFLVNSCHDLAFITVHAGLAQALFNDIDQYTNNQHSYTKHKLQLDLNVLEMLWAKEVDTLFDYVDNHHLFWQRRLTVYAFAKKTLLNVTTLVTELTGSGLFEIACPSNQRYKDALIYSSHFKNLPQCIKDMTNNVYK